MALPVVAIGASAGGVKALATLTEALPKGFPAAVLVVCHMSPSGPNLLPQVLARGSSLPVLAAQDDLEIEAGKVYVSVPDRHLMLDGSHLRLTRGPKENRTRPAIDVLFRSVASSRGPQAIGVVLTGYLDDGAAGLWTIKDVGGQAIVQDPEDADVPDMPLASLLYVTPEVIAPLAQLPDALLRAVRLSESRAMPSLPSDQRLEIETAIARGDNALAAGSLRLGPPSSLTCPECGGAMAEINESARIRFRCHTGHAYSVLTLLSDIDRCIDQSLWHALRSIEERALLLAKLQTEAENGNKREEASKAAQALQDTRKRGDILRQLLLDEQALGHAIGEPK
jgi:two-component system, chemotaxis family, protein-glutamate methylesterase/glutaminase